MAQTEHLPIYKASYDLCLYLEQVVREVRPHASVRDRYGTFLIIDRKRFIL
jgi:hypothetical protein